MSSAPSEDPLLQLSLEALTQLSNVGLVKRAQRELAAAPPQVARGADGILRALFADGVSTEFAPGAGIADARCSCGAQLCRHRLIAVLAWQAVAEHVPTPLRSPGVIDDARLLDWAGATAYAQAERLRQLGLLVDVRRASADDPVPTARLPQATVRFHGGDDPGAAQSDATASDHRSCVVLGMWAFRAADAQDAEALTVRVQLGTRQVAADALQAPLMQLIAGLLRHGLAGGEARHAPALSAASDAARRLGSTWMQLALLDLELWLAAYGQRSAGFVAAHGVRLLAEIVARQRAARGAGELAPQHALGIGERLETPLARVRLRALGLRISADGEQRRARLALLDQDTATRMALSCTWDNAGNRGAACTQRAREVRVGNSVRLGALATGQLVTVSAHRRADGELRLGAGHGGRTSLLAQSADWSDLPPALVFSRLADWRAAQAHLPPGLLCPRMALGAHLVFRPSQVGELGFDPATQSVYAMLIDADGDMLLLTRAYESAAPGALDAVAAALSDARPCHIAGVLHQAGGLPELDPWALSNGTELIIPDLHVADGRIRDLPIGSLPVATDVLTRRLDELDDSLAQRLLGGATAPRWLERQAHLGAALARAGLSDLASGLAALVEVLLDPVRGSDDHSVATAAGTLLLRLHLGYAAR